MSLAAALQRAETTGQPQTYDYPERRIRVRVRVNEYSERQLALASPGGVTEAQAVAIAVEAGFGMWTTDRSGAALLLTETEAADGDPEPEEAPVPDVAQTGTVLQRVSRRLPLCMADRDEVNALIHAGLLHVSPIFDRAEVCPYHLTDAGHRALRS